MSVERPPLVSIIIPCYNAAPYLAAAIESCLAQSYPHCEIIVVDDGSTDESAQVAQQFPQVQYHYQESRGVSAARNRGVRESQGAFLQFLDADDVLLPLKIQRCMEVLSARPELAVVYTDYELRSADLSQAIAIERPTLRPQGLIFYDLFYHPSAYWGVHCALTRREAFEGVGGFVEGVAAAEDWNLWVRMAVQQSQFAYIDEVLVWYRSTPESASKDPLKMAYGRLLAMLSLENAGLPPGVDLDTHIAERHHVMAMKLWMAEQRGMARHHLMQAIQRAPYAWRGRALLWLLSWFLPAQRAEKWLRRS